MGGYRVLLSRSSTWWWMVATVATRLAVCTVPLAVVFIAEAHTGSYAWGAVVVGAYAVGEAVAAPWMGARFQRCPLRAELRRVAVVEAVALVGVVVALRGGVPLGAVVLAAVGGGVASGTFGGLRTVLVSSALGERESAMALDVIVNQVCQIAGPALAAGAVVLGEPDVALLAVAAGLVAVVGVAGRLPESLGGSAAGAGGAVGVRVLRVVWPSVVVAVVVMALQAVVEVTLPGVVEGRGGAAGWAGVALSLLAVFSVVGSFVYGVRRWRGSVLGHTLVLASLFGGVVVGVGVVGSVVATVVLVGVAGFFQAAASTARGVSVAEALPVEEWSVAFSVLYSCGAVGFAVASGVAAVVLAGGGGEGLLVGTGVGGCAVFLVVGVVRVRGSVGRVVAGSGGRWWRRIG